MFILSKKYMKKEIFGKYPLSAETARQCAEWLSVTRGRGHLTTSETYQRVKASDRIAKDFRDHKKVIQGS